jgi:hypothetical protein
VGTGAWHNASSLHTAATNVARQLRGAAHCC